MTTKQKIVYEALNLFSIKGYKGTSVKNIAEAVGIKDSSLYKHYKNKKEIFDTIVFDMRKRMGDMSKHFGLADDDFDKALQIYANLSLEGLQGLSKNIFLFYLKDDFMSKFWRMANMEQYQNTEIYNIYRQIFMEESITYQTALFKKMADEGVFIKVNPRVMAVNFYAPIFFLLSKYSGRPQIEQEAIAILEEQVTEFYRIYSIVSNKNQII